MGHAYRSAYEHIIGTRLAETERARASIEIFEPQLRRIRARRLARVLGGSVGIAGAITMGALAALDTRGGSATTALLGSALGAIGTYIVARVVLGIADRSWTVIRAADQPRLAGELDADLAELDRKAPARLLQARFSRLEPWSTGLPLVAASLLTPLTMHYLVACLGSHSDRSYADWIRVSGVIVGHAHITLAVFAFLFARKMKRMTRDELAGMKIAREWIKALGFAVVAACVPGIVFLLVPPLLSLVTGLAFVPLMFILTRRSLLAERTVIDEASEVAPTAVRVEDVARAEEVLWGELGPAEEAPRPMMLV